MILPLLFRRWHFVCLFLPTVCLLFSTRGYTIEEEKHGDKASHIAPEELLQKSKNRVTKVTEEKETWTEEVVPEDDVEENADSAKEESWSRRRNPLSSQWPQWHPARRHLRNWSTSDALKRHMPYHPVARFRGPLFDSPSEPLFFNEVDDDNAKSNMSAGQILALLNNLMTEGRFKGLRFGISKR